MNYEEHKLHAISILEKVIEEIKNETFNLENIPTRYSPAGDGYGKDNTYIDFGSPNDSLDISELFYRLEGLKLEKIRKFKNEQKVEIIINKEVYHGEIQYLSEVRDGVLFYAVRYEYKGERRFGLFTEKLLLEWNKKKA